MNGFHNEFIDMRSDGYIDGVMVKILSSSTKARGIGTCIIVCRGENGLFHQTFLNYVLYVPKLLHSHPIIFSVI
jgi:hypothetical protein